MVDLCHPHGLNQIETRVMDGEKLDLPDASFDVVLCRLGLMYMPHPLTALREWPPLSADARNFRLPSRATRGWLTCPLKNAIPCGTK